jgi:hypothetical protein
MGHPNDFAMLNKKARPASDEAGRAFLFPIDSGVFLTFRYEIQQVEELGKADSGGLGALD